VCQKNENITSFQDEKKDSSKSIRVTFFIIIYMHSCMQTNRNTCVCELQPLHITIVEIQWFIRCTWGSSIRRPFKAFNNHVYLPGSRSCKNHKTAETLSMTRNARQMTLHLARDMHHLPDQIT
jgi:hypothetical protein